MGLRASSWALLSSGLPMVAVVPAALAGAGGPCLPAPSPSQPQGKGQDAPGSKGPGTSKIPSAATSPPLHPRLEHPGNLSTTRATQGAGGVRCGQTFPLFPAPMGAEAQHNPVPPSGRLFRDGKHQEVLGVNPAAHPKPSQLPAWDMYSGSAHVSIGLSGNLLKSHLPTHHTTEKVISSKEVLRAPHLFLSC